IETCHSLLPAERHDRAMGGVDALVQEFTRIAKGMMMLGERPPRSVDEAISIGERLSALLMAEYLECQGIPAAAVNASLVIATDAAFGNASPLMEPTRQRASKVLRPLL